MNNLNNFINSIDKYHNFDIFDGIFFFLCFSRFEYAIKKEGFLDLSVNYASADWIAYGESILLQITPKLVNISSSIDYFVEHPVRKQVVSVSNQLIFQDAAYDHNRVPFIWSLMMIKRARNNLFHGGKYIDQVVEDEIRNKTLIQHSMKILNECLKLDNNTTYYFKEPIA